LRAGLGGRRRCGTGRREGADGQQSAGGRGVQGGPIVGRPIEGRLIEGRLVERCLGAQGFPFAYLGEALGQPGEHRGKLVDEGGGDHVCEHI
jgi:hypothetical protein